MQGRGGEELGLIAGRGVVYPHESVTLRSLVPLLEGDMIYLWESVYVHNRYLLYASIPP